MKGEGLKELNPHIFIMNDNMGVVSTKESVLGTNNIKDIIWPTTTHVFYFFSILIERLLTSGSYGLPFSLFFIFFTFFVFFRIGLTTSGSYVTFFLFIFLFWFIGGLRPPNPLGFCQPKADGGFLGGACPP